MTLCMVGFGCAMAHSTRIGLLYKKFTWHHVSRCVNTKARRAWLRVSSRPWPPKKRPVTWVWSNIFLRCVSHIFMKSVLWACCWFYKGDMHSDMPHNCPDVLRQIQTAPEHSFLFSPPIPILYLFMTWQRPGTLSICIHCRATWSPHSKMRNKTLILWKKSESYFWPYLLQSNQEINHQ